MESTHSQTITLGKRILVPGVLYTVSRSFDDDSGVTHAPGEQLRYLGFESPKLYAGYVLYFLKPLAGEIRMRLSYRESGQREIVTQFESYLECDDISTSDLLARFSSSSTSALERVRAWIDPIPDTAEHLVSKLRVAIGNASAADDRSGRDNPYFQITADLVSVEKAAIAAIGELAINKTS